MFIYLSIYIAIASVINDLYYVSVLQPGPSRKSLFTMKTQHRSSPSPIWSVSSRCHIGAILLSRKPSTSCTAAPHWRDHSRVTTSKRIPAALRPVSSRTRQFCQHPPNSSTIGKSQYSSIHCPPLFMVWMFVNISTCFVFFFLQWHQRQHLHLGHAHP